jgi:archaemetzincin
MKQYLFLLVFGFLIISCNTISKKEETVIGIQVYDSFSKAKTDTIIKTISHFYNLKTIILPEEKLPKSAFTNYKAPRFRADSLIKIQKRKLPDSIDFIIGLTEKDICITKLEKDGSVKKPINKYTDFGIMGLGYCPGKSCIVSTFRLKNKNENIFLSRFKKVCIHEVGHNLGLPHCPNKKCVMTDAVERIASIDNANLELCEACKSMIN